MHKLIPKHLNSTGEQLLELLPIYGTYQSGRRLFLNPSWSKAADFGLDLTGDVLSLIGVGTLAKGMKAAKVASKIGKKLNKIDDIYTYSQPSTKYITKQKQGLDAMSLLHAPEHFIIDRIKKIDHLKYLNKWAPERNELALKRIKLFYDKQSGLVDQSNNLKNAAKILIPSNIPFHASSKAVNNLNE